MATFLDLYKSFDGDSGKRGKQFESFVKWFLMNEPEWASQVDQVWLWDEYPGRWGADCGIDLVFRHKNGEMWAVQAKCYSPQYSITKHDVDKFLSESNRNGISKRLLIASTDGIGANAKQVCDAQEKLVVRYLLSNFESAKVEYPSKIENLKSLKRKDPPLPRPHQLEAIEAVNNNFKNIDRGQLIMACGTGKTFTTLWIKEALASKSTLVLLPSLSLLSQTLKEWTFATKEQFSVLCVCSDQTVGKRGEDEIIHSVSDLAFPVTSNPEDIKQFIYSNGNKVVFSTYQSSPLVAEAFLDKSLPSFDLIVADEAHRCTGKVSSDFSTVLDGDRIRSKKRLFTTATPRTYTASVKKAAAERGADVVGMDDEAIFGKVLFSLTFGEAIKKELLTDFRVIIVGVDDPMIATWIENRELVETETGIESDAASLAAQIGLLKAIKDYDLKRVISFHSRVTRAEAFSKEIHKVCQWVDISHKPSGELWSDYVSGDMPADKRRIKLDLLKSLKTNQRGLLTNARCLSEGVDVPSLDGVAFIDPRGSQVDIIQAVGRAIRLSKDKKFGTIILPVFIAKGEDGTSSIEASNFKPIWDVLNALKSHDDELSNELDMIRTELGKRSGAKSKFSDLSKIEVDLPSSVSKSFADSLCTYLIERTTDSWSFWFGLLLSYVEKNKTAWVPSTYITPEGYKLGNWVTTQRKILENAGKINSRRSMIDKLPGWSWDPFNDKWEIGYKYLLKFYDDFRHLHVGNYKFPDSGYKLGVWVAAQRENLSALSSYRKKKLEEVPGWTWDPVEDLWNNGYEELLCFIKVHGSSIVPNRYVTQGGFKLGEWVLSQRRKVSTLSKSRVEKLIELPKWTWDPVNAQWDAAFNAFKQFVKLNGHGNVPRSCVLDDGTKLGDWVGTQRWRWGRNELSEDRLKILNSCNGWTWDPISDDREKWFKLLVQYQREFGHCRVPQKYICSSGEKLGSWVSTTRSIKDRIPIDFKQRLTDLNGWSWNLYADSHWEDYYERLQSYVSANDNCNVSWVFMTVDGFPLGKWVAQMKKTKTITNSERILKLEKINGWIWEES